MKIIHVMADGSTRESVKGAVIQNEEFYQAARRIIENKEKQK